MSRELALEGDIRQAIENYTGDYIAGPAWDAVVEGVARAIILGQLTLDQAARVDLALRKTGDQSPDECPTCAAGMRW